MVTDGGVASCLDAETGKTHWRERMPGKYSASPLAGQGRVSSGVTRGERP